MSVNTAQPVTASTKRKRDELQAQFRRFLVRNRNVLIIWGVLFVVVIVAALLSPSFTNPRNFPNLMRQSGALLLVSLGQTIVLLIAGIDLSVGSIISLVVVVMARTMQATPESMVLTAILGIFVGLLVGLINGIAVARLRLAPFMVTLATLSLIQGAALLIWANTPATIPREFSAPFTGNLDDVPLLGSVPMPLIIIIGMTTLCWIILRHTPFGRHLYAIGSNENATRLSGMATDRIKIMAYTWCGMLAGAAGVYMAARSRAGDPLLGRDFAFDSITAVVLGGTRLTGGAGSVWGTVAGVFIITVLNNILNLLGVPSDYQYILKGGLLVIAVMLFRER